MSKQNNLTDFLTDVADAIRQKKGTQAPINPQDFSSEIASIPTGGNNPLQDMLDRSSDTYGHGIFYAYQNIFVYLTYEDLLTLDFSKKKYTNTSDMFHGCLRLTTIPQLDLSSVTNASFMFDGCNALTTIPQLDLSHVTNATAMFEQCASLTTIPQLDLSSVTNTNNMFYGCNMTKLDFLNIKQIGSAFIYSNNRLAALIIRNAATLAILQSTSAFNNSAIASGTGYIYVPDNLVDSYKQATNWSTYASQIKGLSELPQGD